MLNDMVGNAFLFLALLVSLLCLMFCASTVVCSAVGFDNGRCNRRRPLTLRDSDS